MLTFRKLTLAEKKTNKLIASFSLKIAERSESKFRVKKLKFRFLTI